MGPREGGWPKACGGGARARRRRRLLRSVERADVRKGCGAQYHPAAAAPRRCAPPFPRRPLLSGQAAAPCCDRSPRRAGGLLAPTSAPRAACPACPPALRSRAFRLPRAIPASWSPQALLKRPYTFPQRHRHPLAPRSPAPKLPSIPARGQEQSSRHLPFASPPQTDHHGRCGDALWCSWEQSPTHDTRGARGSPGSRRAAGPHLPPPIATHPHPPQAPPSSRGPCSRYSP